MTDKTLKNLTDITASTALADADIGYVVRPSTDTDYKTSLGSLKTYFAPRKPQLVATHTAIPNSVYAANTGSRTDVQQQIRQGHWIGKEDVSQLQIGMIGFYTPQNLNTGDVAIGNDFTWEAGIETVAPAPVMTRNSSFRGQKTTTIPSNGPLVLTDPLTIGVAAGSAIYTRQNIVISDYSTGKFLSSARASYNGANTLSSLSASQVPGTGALTTPAGGVTTYARMHPAVILGIPKNPMPSVLLIGDSISAGTGDAAADARGMIGYLARGLDNVNGFPVPWHAQTTSGWALEGQKIELSPATRDVWQYCTHVIFALGFNDMSGSTLAVMQAKTTNVLTELKRVIGPYGKALQVTCATITPQTTSSNSFVDAVGQTASTKFLPGGQRDQYNTWLFSLAGGGLVDQVLDLRAATEDPSDNSKWYTNGTANFPTSDGTHPKTGIVTRMATVVNTWAQAIKP